MKSCLNFDQSIKNVDNFDKCDIKFEEIKSEINIINVEELKTDLNNKDV